MHEAIGIPAEVQRFHVMQAAHEQCGTDEQHDGQGRLREQEDGTNSGSLSTAFPLACLECAVDVGAKRVHGRREPRQQAGDDRCRSGEQEHARIEHRHERPIHVPAGAVGGSRPRPSAPAQARASPPSTATTTLSVRSCATRRLRLTPNAMRTAISRRRRMPRAISRLATFAHAMSSTMTDTPASHVATVALSDAFGPRSIGSGANWPRVKREILRPNRLRLRLCRGGVHSALSVGARELRTRDLRRHAGFETRDHLEPRHIVLQVVAVRTAHVHCRGRDRHVRSRRRRPDTVKSLRRDTDDRVLPPTDAQLASEHGSARRRGATASNRSRARRPVAPLGTRSSSAVKNRPSSGRASNSDQKLALTSPTASASALSPEPTMRWSS